MFQRSSQPGNLLRLSDHDAPSQPQSSSREPPGRRYPKPQPPASSSGWQSTALFSLCCLVLFTTGLAYYAFERARTVEMRLQASVAAMKADMSDLRTTVNFDAVRTRLLLGMRDEILRVNGHISLGEAHRYAEVLLDVTDKYASVDPVLLLSIGIVESEFDARARSHADARGLYQIWPSTGRMLAQMLGWEYEDGLLYEPEYNTEMAALYLDVLMTTYNDVGMALAEYNGGPINAGYYRARSGRTAPETRDYVPKVLENYHRLSQSLPLSPGRSYDIVYRDPTRDGKQISRTRGEGFLSWVKRLRPSESRAD